MDSSGIETDSDEDFWNDLDSKPIHVTASPQSHRSSGEIHRRASG